MVACFYSFILPPFLFIFFFFMFTDCSSLVLDEVERQSTCELEVDAVAVDVLNRLEIESKFTQYCSHKLKKATGGGM